MDHAMDSLKTATATERGQIEILRKKVKAQSKSKHQKQHGVVTELKQKLRIAQREAEAAEKDQTRACTEMSKVLEDAAMKVQTLKKKQDAVDDEVAAARHEMETLQTHLSHTTVSRKQIQDQEKTIAVLEEEKHTLQKRVEAANENHLEILEHEEALSRELASMNRALEASRAEMSRFKVDLISIDQGVALEQEWRELDAICTRKQQVIAALSKELEARSIQSSTSVIATTEAITAAKPPKLPAAHTAGVGDGPAWFVSGRGVITSS